LFHRFSSCFTLISAHTNFHDPRTTPSGRKVIRYRRKKEREKNSEFSGAYVCHAARLQRHTESARTSLEQTYLHTHAKSKLNLNLGVPYYPSIHPPTRNSFKNCTNPNQSLNLRFLDLVKIKEAIKKKLFGGADIFPPF
jgi:hypothetical protein